MNITNLTAKDVEKIEIDHGIIYINYGEEDERLLAPSNLTDALGKLRECKCATRTERRSRRRFSR